jgi:hypothetical protein
MSWELANGGPTSNQAQPRSSKLTHQGRRSTRKKSDENSPPEMIMISHCGSQFLHGKYLLTPDGRYVRTVGTKTYEILQDDAIIEDEDSGDDGPPLCYNRRAWFISRTDDGVEYNLDYYWAYEDPYNPDFPPTSDWNTLFGRDQPPKLRFGDMFKPGDNCLAQANARSKPIRGRILHKAQGGYIVEVSDKKLPTYFPSRLLKLYVEPALEVGDLVETKIISGRYRDVWIDCQITAVNKTGLFNLRVFNHREYNVCAYAKDVPRRLIRKKVGVSAAVKKKLRTQFQIGQLVETQIISGIHGGKWIGARITSARVDGTYDIDVLNPAQYNVSSRAVSVPASYLRKPKRNSKRIKRN